ncbi:MAG: hypothetical protein HYS04_05800 [Acidobacteria bacterium]|nr:hypothetical protein [Acidobacteriota bacterium]
MLMLLEFEEHSLARAVRPNCTQGNPPVISLDPQEGNLAPVPRNDAGDDARRCLCALIRDSALLAADQVTDDQVLGLRVRGRNPPAIIGDSPHIPGSTIPQQPGARFLPGAGAPHRRQAGPRLRREVLLVCVVPHHVLKRFARFLVAELLVANSNVILRQRRDRAGHGLHRQHLAITVDGGLQVAGDAFLVERRSEHRFRRLRLRQRRRGEQHGHQ